MNTVNSLASSSQPIAPSTSPETSLPDVSRQDVSRPSPPSTVPLTMPQSMAMTGEGIERLTALAVEIVAEVQAGLIAETPQKVLIERARQGEAEAIAELMRRDLRHHGIEVSAWTRGRTLRLELASSRWLSKPEALAFIRNGMDFLQAEGIDAVQVSAYVKDEFDPRWVERLNLKLKLTQRVRPRWGQGLNQALGQALGQRIGQGLEQGLTLVRGSGGPWAIAASTTVLIGAMAIASLSGSQIGSTAIQASPTTTESVESAVEP